MLKRLDARLCICLLAIIAVAASPAGAALVNLTPAAGTSNSATSVTLADLVGGNVMGLTVGDKTFTGFSYSPSGDMPTAANVNVLGFKDGAGNWGVTFQGAFLDLPGGGASDAAVRFVVGVAPGQTAPNPRKITDAHLQLGGVGMGANSFFTVDESFAPDSNNTLSAFMSTIAPGGTQLNDSTIFGTPLTTLHVTKDILALAGAGSFLPARATVIDQSFSQTPIPEPATVMLGLTGLALVGVNRRRG
jgi:hypothetical protein